MHQEQIWSAFLRCEPPLSVVIILSRSYYKELRAGVGKLWLSSCCRTTSPRRHCKTDNHKQDSQRQTQDRTCSSATARGWKFAYPWLQPAKFMLPADCWADSWIPPERPLLPHMEQEAFSAACSGSGQAFLTRLWLLSKSPVTPDSRQNCHDSAHDLKSRLWCQYFLTAP